MQGRTTSVTYAVLNGVFWGIVVSFIANSERWHCLLPEETLEEFHKRPWKVLANLEENPSDRSSMIFVWKVEVLDAKLRFMARETFGSITRLNDKRFVVVFITGFRNPASQKLLSQENDKYGDLLTFNVPDNARTADSQLMLSAFKWIADDLTDLFEFVITTHNNELMPFIPAIVDFVEEGDIAPDRIYCSSVQYPAPRPSDPMIPHYIKATEYNSSYFPSHCRPQLVILKREIMSKICELGRRTTISEIPSEIYLWGVLREKLRGHGAKNIVKYEESMKDAPTPLILSYRVQFSRFDAISQAKEVWDAMKAEFTAEHRDKSGRNIRVTYSQIIRNDEYDRLISKESEIFIKKWLRL